MPFSNICLSVPVNSVLKSGKPDHAGWVLKADKGGAMGKFYFIDHSYAEVILSRGIYCINYQPSECQAEAVVFGS